MWKRCHYPDGLAPDLIAIHEDPDGIDANAAKLKGQRQGNRCSDRHFRVELTDGVCRDGRKNNVDAGNLFRPIAVFYRHSKGVGFQGVVSVYPKPADHPYLRTDRQLRTPDGVEEPAQS